MSDKETAPLGTKLARELRRRCNTRLSLLHQSAWYEAANELAKFADTMHAEECTAPAPQPGVETDYYWKDGSLKWGHPVNVEHLILQLQTLDPKMKVSSVHHVSLKEGTKARAYGLSMSRERWNELGWLDWTLDGPECLAIWAEPNEHVHGTNSGAAATPQVTPTDARIQAFWNAQAEWSRATFGSDAERDHIGPLKHLAKEAIEAQVRPADRTEIADCQFLVFDAARRSGMTLIELFDVCEQKLIVNKARKWSRPTSDNPVEHVREGTSEQASPTPDPFSKGYKHREGNPVSDACGDGKHSQCTQDYTKCHCTFRGGHMVPHLYAELAEFPSRSQEKRIRTMRGDKKPLDPRNTGVSLDGGKTIHSKFKND